MRITPALVLLVISASAVRAQEHKPLALHPDNPHYFLFRGKPTVLITSGEHYGAVLNREFDYVKYLDELAAHGLNNTRVFSGAYCEPPGAFKIAGNTLAPAKGKFLAPWARSDVPGYAGGGAKFDLTRWNPEYFARLKDFMTQASKRGIVVEMNLFCPFYEDTMWALSPQNAANNTNGLGKVKRTDVYTLDRSGGLLTIHEAMVKKFVAELNGFDNLYFEICNEPYFGGVTMAWQERMIDVLAAAERELPRRHLISLNVANGSAKVEKPHAGVSIFNFHYATPPATVGINYDLNKPIGDNETGFKGIGDTHYRMEAWQFLLAGGALYNNLDYSFTVGHEDGSFSFPPTQPGGGGKNFRTQMKVLKSFMESLDFVRMKPDPAVVKNKLPAKTTGHALVEPGRQIAVYLFGGGPGPTPLTFDLPAGKYTIEWTNPTIGPGPREELDHPGGPLTQMSPKYGVDIAVKVVRAP